MSSVTTSGATRSAFSFARIWDQFGMLVVFAVLFIGCVIFVPNFASFVNMKGLGLAISMSGMVACGMLFCLASGDFDLSVASVIACAGVTTAVVINLSESLWLGIVDKLKVHPGNEFTFVLKDGSNFACNMNCNRMPIKLYTPIT